MLGDTSLIFRMCRSSLLIKSLFPESSHVHKKLGSLLWLLSSRNLKLRITHRAGLVCIEIEILGLDVMVTRTFAYAIPTKLKRV